MPRNITASEMARMIAAMQHGQANGLVMRIGMRDGRAPTNSDGKCK